MNSHAEEHDCHGRWLDDGVHGSYYIWCPGNHRRSVHCRALPRA